MAALRERECHSETTAQICVACSTAHRGRRGTSSQKPCVQFQRLSVSLTLLKCTFEESEGVYVHVEEVIMLLSLAEAFPIALDATCEACSHSD